MAKLKYIQMEDDDADLLEQLIKALRRPSASGGMSMRFVPGSGFSIVGGRGGPRPTGATAESTMLVAPFRIIAVNDVDGNRQTWAAKRLAPTKEQGYNNWTDHSTDDADYTLRSIDEYGSRGSGPWKEEDFVYAMPQAVTGADPEWFIIGGLDGSVPEGEGQYKVLQLDGQDQPHWDYVRAYE